jgi:CheY-like chemotaxis protein
MSQNLVKIAVIDNDKIYQTITHKLLSKISQNIEVMVFMDGVYAFEFFSESSPESWPDLILLDIEMPIMDGWEFLESLFPLFQKYQVIIPIYMVSSSIALTDKRKALDFTQVLGYLEKPLTLEDLNNVLNDLNMLNAL